MKPLFNSRVKRHTAFVVLFAWLFGLASGAANACLIEPRGTHSHDSVAGPMLSTEELEGAETPAEHGVSGAGHHHESVLAEQGAGTVGHHHDSDAPGTPCQKVCDEGSKSLLKQQTTSAPIDSGLAPFVVVAWTASEAAIVSAPRQARAHEPPRPRLAVRVLFSRLAL